MTIETFRRGWTIMAEYWGKNDPLTAEGGTQLKIYWEHLKRMDDDLFLKTVSKAISTKNWFPRINELREIATTLIPEQAIITAGDAWELARKTVKHISLDITPERRITSGNEEIDRLVRQCGGYRKLALANDDTWMRKEFMKAYESTVIRKIVELHLGAGVPQGAGDPALASGDEGSDLSAVTGGSS